jgi:signal transduction histidine kinase
VLHEILTTYREEIIARSRAKVATRTAPQPTHTELEHGVPLFLDQLVETLRREQDASNPPISVGIEDSARRHGNDMRRSGFTVAQVVHDYGNICQAVTELAVQRELPISTNEFRTLNRCLDDAIAGAVSEYARQSERSLSVERTERLGFFAHELRNLLSSALIAFDVLKGGSVAIGGSTGAILGRNLIRLRDLIDRTLAELRLERKLCRKERLLLAGLIEEVELAASMEANARGHKLTVTPVDSAVAIDVDRQLVGAALANLLQNAFKFSRPNGHVTLRIDTATTTDRVLIEVEDECGGLPPGQAEDLFRPFKQHSTDRSGLGLGLTIARDGIAVNDGELRVRNLPGRGCVFTADLPRLRGRTTDARAVNALSHGPESVGGSARLRIEPE